MARIKPKTAGVSARREAVFRTVAGGTLGCAYLPKTGPRQGYTGRFNDEYIGIFVLRGRGVAYAPDGTEQPVGPGDFIQHLPGGPHGVVPHDDRWVEFYFRFPGSLCAALRDIGVLDERPVLHPGLDAELLERLDLLLTDLQRTPQRRLGQVLCRMHELVVTAYRLDHEPRADQTAQMIDEACAALARDPEARIDLPALAISLGLSYDRFRKLFRGQVGVSPGEYRIRRRIDHAQHLIAQERLSVKAAAYRLGYPDPYTFSKQFKRYTGQSPTAFLRSL